MRKSSQISIQKDLQILELTKQMNKVSIQSEVNSSLLLFTSFETVFSKEDMKVIRSVPAGTMRDSKFVNKIMTALYKDTEVKKLFHRSAAGRKHKGTQKSAVTPEKRKIVAQMLEERVKFEIISIDGNETNRIEEIEKRNNRLNQFIRSAIHNILSAIDKKTKSKAIESVDSAITSTNQSQNLPVVCPTAQDHYLTVQDQCLTAQNEFPPAQAGLSNHYQVINGINSTPYYPLTSSHQDVTYPFPQMNSSSYYPIHYQPFGSAQPQQQYRYQ